MNVLTVKLWGEELGRLVWDQVRKTTYFVFNPKNSNRADVSPLMHPADKWNVNNPIFGDTRRIYQNLPPFIADSLPDSWGNKVFDKWIKRNRIPKHKVTPLYKLMFIGKRSMGALEFEPAAEELIHPKEVDVKSLYDLSLEIQEQRESTIMDYSDELKLHTILAVGTSAGGRQMKAILAINPTTGEIRSGQIETVDGFDYFILKFEDKVLPSSEIEMAYYDMATTSGIEMEDCRLMSVEGVKHFMTKRFDRKNGEKIHMQTLAAINPDVDSYEDLFATCRSLKLTETEISQLFRRLVFNVMANNTDDHNKNFSFLLDRTGRWRLSPAYDLTFIFNRYGTDAETTHCLSLYGKTDDITKEDLIYIAKENSIRNAEEIISQVADSVAKFQDFASKYDIPSNWSHIINKTLHRNLVNFGYVAPQICSVEFVDSKGRMFKDISVSTSSKGIYQLSTSIDGKTRRRFIKPSDPTFEEIRQYEIGSLSLSSVKELLIRLFPE